MHLKNVFGGTELDRKNVKYIIFFAVILMIAYLFNEWTDSFQEQFIKEEEELLADSSTFKIISSSENEDIEPILKKIAKKENIDIDVEYAGTLEIMEKLNAGQEYDAVWASNSIWLYMLNENVKVSESKSTSINPVVFAITESKAN